MRINAFVQCTDFPCSAARQSAYLVPGVDLDPESIRLILVSETSPADLHDHYYSGSDALFARTTLQAFQEAGVSVSSIVDLLQMGVYLTTAVKCGKYDYAVAGSTITTCSKLLEREISLFPNIQAFLLMGDVAIRSLNTIARRQGEKRVIPAGSTYKIRAGEFRFRGKRVFPSYLQAGPSYGIEKSKQRMIAQDISSAVRAAGII